MAQSATPAPALMTSSCCPGVIDVSRGPPFQGEQLIDQPPIVEQIDAAGVDQRQQIDVQIALALFTAELRELLTRPLAYRSDHQ